MSRRRPNNKIDPYKLFRVYLESDFNDEVAEKLGVPNTTVVLYASRLRKRGVKLPYRYGNYMRIDAIDELNELIETMEAATNAPDSHRNDTKPTSEPPTLTKASPNHDQT